MRVEHTATFHIECDSDALATMLRRSIEPELAPLTDARSRAEIAVEDRVLSLRIEAADLIACRAAVNTWAGLLGVAEEVGTMTEEPPA